MTGKNSVINVKQPVLSNLMVRLLTALVLVPLGLIGARIGGVIWTALLMPLAVVGVLEFYLLARGRNSGGSTIIGIPIILGVMVAFHLEAFEVAGLLLLVGTGLAFVREFIRSGDSLEQVLRQTTTTLFGILYIGLPLASLIALRALPEGFLWVMVVFSATWGTDTFAYFGGRAFGKHKLAPRLSPSKTIEGAFFGVWGGFLPALLFVAVQDKLSVAAVIMILFAPLVAIAGDLFESALKRFFGVKDSHIHGLNILPGHGGVLDRIDSLLMVTGYVYVFILITGIG